jgi:tellurite methyltransferase
MSIEDAFRWNTRYQQSWYNGIQSPRRLLLEHAHLLPEQGLALDVAMGTGSSAAFLLQHGLRVIGVDIASVAVRQAKAKLPTLQAIIADLENFTLPAESFEVICNFYYLNRPLWQDYYQMLRPGGLLMIETLTREMLALMPDLEPDYLLEPGELLYAFSGWRVIYYREGWTVSERNSIKAVASLVASKR